MGIKKTIIMLLIICGSLNSQIITGISIGSDGTTPSIILNNGISVSDVVSGPTPPVMPRVPMQGNVTYAWDIESDKGLGVNTFSSAMESLVNQADVLNLRNNPTNNGTYITFLSSNDQYAQFLVGSFGADFTIAIKAVVHAVPTTNYLFIDEGTSFFRMGATEKSFVYYTTAFTGGTTPSFGTNNYGSDSTLAFNSDGDCFRNGYLRLDQSLTLVGALNGWFDLGGYGGGQVDFDFYYLYAWNTIVPADSLKQLNP